MTEEVQVAIVGAGQAGLSTSWYLKQAGVEHVVLEAARVAETWRTRRWDSFCLVTPNWSVKLPGNEYAGSDPDGYMQRDELVKHFERWSRGFEAPVRGDCAVSTLEARGDAGFLLETAAGPLAARNVVVATGGYQRPHLPAGSRDFGAGVTQLLAEEYRNPGALPEGAVLIVGSGQTGCQLAEELHDAGHKVILACGHCSWAPRRFGGHDVVWWVIESGFWNRTVADLPSPGARLLGNILATGHGGGHDMHYRTLHAKGIELVGRYLGAGHGRVHFDPDLDAIVAAADVLTAGLRKWIDALCEKRGIESGWRPPAPFHVASRGELDIAAEGISTVIWTTGYRPGYEWVHVPVFDEMGFPIQTNGHTSVPGLYFMGVHFQRKAQSAVLYGVGEDAELVAQHIVDKRR